MRAYLSGGSSWCVAHPSVLLCSFWCLQASCWHPSAVALMATCASGESVLHVDTSFVILSPSSGQRMQQNLSSASSLVMAATITDWLCCCCRNWHSGSLHCKQKGTADLTGVVFTEDSSHVLAAGRTALKVCGCDA